MSEPRGHNGETSLAVVIASYNSAPWLPSTIRSLAAALARTEWTPEIIVVDDGSTDDTVDVLEAVARDIPYRLTVLSQANGGRFMARWAGITATAAENVLILDSRLLVHEDALRHLEQELPDHPEFAAWNGHVATDPASPLVGRFWEVPTYVFWGDYLADPRPTTITLDNFDRVPKGTGFLLVRRQLFEDACRASWPTENAHLTSDDTKLLRFVAAASPIRLDPGFSATYRPRTSVSLFLGHSFDRGTLFVDSYAGTSALRNVVLLLLVTLPPLAAVLAAVLVVRGWWIALVALLAIAVIAALVPLAIAATRRCPPRAGLSYLAYLLPFGMAFWAGLARGIVIHRSSFKKRLQHAREV